MLDFVNIVKGVAGFIGFYIGFVVGPVNGLFIALCIFMVLDYLTGVTSAIISKTLDSEIGFRGLARKVFILVLVGVAHLIDAYVIGGTDAARNTVICWYLANEGISIIENAARIGLPVPAKLRAILEQLKEDGDNGSTNNNNG